MKNLIYKIRNFASLQKHEFHGKFNKDENPLEIFTEKDVLGQEKPKAMYTLPNYKSNKLLIGTIIILLLLFMLYLAIEPKI